MRARRVRVLPRTNLLWYPNLGNTQADDIRRVVESIVGILVDRQDRIDVQAFSAGVTLLIVVKADESDIGKIVGKSGATLSAINTIARNAAIHTGKWRTSLVEVPRTRTHGDVGRNIRAAIEGTG